MSTINEQLVAAAVLPPSPTSLWQRRFFIVLTILGWLTLAVAIIWALGQIMTPLVLLGFSALLAYLIYPLVRLFGRIMPRVLAILASLLLLLVVMGLVILFVVAAAVQQFALLIGFIRDLFQHPERHAQFQAALNELSKRCLVAAVVHGA